MSEQLTAEPQLAVFSPKMGELLLRMRFEPDPKLGWSVADQELIFFDQPCPPDAASYHFQTIARSWGGLVHPHFAGYAITRDYFQPDTVAGDVRITYFPVESEDITRCTSQVYDWAESREPGSGVLVVNDWFADALSIKELHPREKQHLIAARMRFNVDNLEP